MRRKSGKPTPKESPSLTPTKSKRCCAPSNLTTSTARRSRHVRRGRQVRASARRAVGAALARHRLDGGTAAGPRELRPQGRQAAEDESRTRSLPLPRSAAVELERHSRKTAYDGPDDRVFCNPETGGPLDHSKLSRRYRAALKAAGLRHLRFHALRHSYGTRLAAAGVDLVKIKTWMGHKDINTTMIYAHYAPAEDEAQTVDAAFAPTPPISPSVRRPILNRSQPTSIPVNPHSKAKRCRTDPAPPVLGPGGLRPVGVQIPPPA